MIMIGLVFAVLYLFVGNYMNTNPGESYGFSIAHILLITGIFCVLNFAWILTILAVSLIIYITVRHKDEKEENIRIRRSVLICAIPCIVFLAFNWIVETFHNARYTDFFFPSILILAVMFILLAGKNKSIKCVCLGSIGVIMKLQSLLTIDPVSRMLFDKIDVGETKLLSTSCTSEVCDNIIYNRQYYGYYIAMSKALSVAMDNMEDTIAISTGDFGRVWEVSGKWDSDYEDGVYEFDEYWDNEKNMRAPGFSTEYDSDPRYTCIKVKYIFPEQEAVSELAGKRSFIYIYIQSLNGGREENVRASFRITDEGTFIYRGWKVSYIRGNA